MGRPIVLPTVHTPRPATAPATPSMVATVAGTAAAAEQASTGLAASPLEPPAPSRLSSAAPARENSLRRLSSEWLSEKVTGSAMRMSGRLSMSGADAMSSPRRSVGDASALVGALPGASPHGTKTWEAYD